MRVVVIGTGHVGLTTCVTLAEIGHDVVGIDSDPEKVEHLINGRAPFFEPGLEDLLRKRLAAGNLGFTTDPAYAIQGAEVAFICVGTPPKENGEANLIAVESAARDIAAWADRRCAVVEKSTVPAGTSERIRQIFIHHRNALAQDLEIASNPEFLREGSAVQDSLEPDRILIGADSEWAFETLRRLYEPLLARGAKLIETNIPTAEIAKHACNAFLATKISFANAVAQMCELIGADIVSVTEVMGTDARIGGAFLNAGLGYGGFCFPKDVAAFSKLSAKLGYPFGLLDEVAKINDGAVAAVARKIEDALWNLDGKRIALLGLSFKPGTDDVRFSPSLALAELLLGGGATVVGYDPKALGEAKSELPSIEVANDPYAAAEGADCIVVATEWEEFSSLDLAALRHAVRTPILVDGRNCLDPLAAKDAGFTYVGVGRAA